VEAVVAPGNVVAIGGELRKDVGGYDLKSLLVGSEGTLGIITAVTLRLLPAPEAALPVVAFFSDAAEGEACALDITASGLQPAVLDFVDGHALSIVRAAYPGLPPDGDAFVLIAEVDGSADSVAAQLEELRLIMAPTALQLDMPAPADVWRWRDGVSGAVASERGGKVSEDVVVPTDRLADAVGAVQSIGAEFDLPACAWGHAGDGNIHASFLIDPRDPAERAAGEAAAERLFGLSVELGGGVTGEHGIGYVKRGQLARQWSPSAVTLHERVKAAFDPTGVFNPGKKLARAAASR
jgi:FAD/FMN-containing dehydrogenase